MKRFKDNRNPTSGRTKFQKLRDVGAVGLNRQSGRNAAAAEPRGMMRATHHSQVPRPATCDIKRDSRKLLNVSAGGVPYEKAKSRRNRQKAALEQSGNAESAVALGAGRTKKKKPNLIDDNIEALESRFENESFKRRALITHKLNTQREAKNQAERMKPGDEDYQQRKSNRSHRKANTRLESREQPATANMTGSNTQDSEMNHRQTGGSKVNRSAGHQKRKRRNDQKSIFDVPQNDISTAKATPVVIDLQSSDSESDSESKDDHLLLKLTHVLQNEAIGRGADHNEMRMYAQHLFRLGLHSKEMILDCLDNFNSSDLDDNTDVTSDIINGWEWMKPFHKSVFYRWVWQQQRKRRRHAKNGSSASESQSKAYE